MVGTASTGSNWLRSPRAERIVFGLAVTYALVQLSRGLWFVWVSSCDLATLYAQWEHLVKAQRLVGPYLPHTHGLLTPLFWLGLPAAIAVVLALNVALIWWMWRQLAGQVGLTRRQQWWGLVLFCDWTATRGVIGHGQLALVVVAGILWTLSAAPRNPAPWLVMSLKHSLSFPFFMEALVRRPRRMLLPVAVLLAVSVGMLAAAGVDWTSLHQSIQQGMTAGIVGQGDVDVSYQLQKLVGSRAAANLVIGGAWLALFAWLVRRMRDRVTLVAALGVMALWPVYHRFYDLVLLAPVLALLIRHRPPVYALGLTVLLAGGYEHLHKWDGYGIGWLKMALPFYYPVVLTAAMVVLIGVERDRAASTELLPPLDPGLAGAKSARH